MKILITGAGGFIGSHLTEKCVDMGYAVKAFLRYNSRNDWGWLENSEKKGDIEIITGDIRDYDSVYNAAKGCKGIFHLAALIGIPYSYVSPLAYIKTNVEGTYNILQAAREANCENILVTSTSETYGTAQHIPITENHPLVGQSPYSASKIAADQMALSFYRSFDLMIKIIRPFNTYGPRQSARSIIPAIISQVLSGNNKIRLGNLNTTRDFSFIDDTVRAFLSIYKSTSGVGEVINVGMNQEIRIGELAEMIGDLMGKKITIETEKARIRPEKSEVELMRCDNTKLLSLTDWKPEYNLRQGLEKTINWIQKNLNFYKTNIYNI
jgi:NAD dependent epimerase/dehydratase